MTSDSNDYDTWVYHALHKAKVVKYSEAVKLYKQGWRDSPDPKVLYKGFRGKYYKLVISYRSFFERIAPHWDSYKLVMVILTLGIFTVALLAILL